jgi:uncharacterized membrane protein YphA (DoxX/SURF4 family)
MENVIIQQTRWSASSLIAFRLIFVYFVIYIVPFPLGWIPYSGLVLQPISSLSFKATEYFGRLVFESAYVSPPASTGSGDTMYNYVQLLFGICLTAIIVLIWSLMDRKRNNYDRLSYWSMIVMRYYLATIMLSYGLAKVFRTQFPPLSLFNLNKSYGESSPMGLLWTFMGYSGVYSVFAGLGEVIGGILLFFRRTRLLGALIVAIVMSHVVVLNFAYDVPVKLFSTHLLLIAILIMIPDWKRLLNFFILNKSAGPEPTKLLYNSQREKWIYFVGKAVILIYMISQTFINNLRTRDAMAEYFSQVQQEPSINGTYEVETFVINNDTLPPTQGNTRRWKEVTITGQKIELQNMDDAAISWHFLGNVGYRRMIIHSPDLSTNGQFTFTSDSSRIIMDGLLHTDTLKVVAKKKAGSEFLLVGRGFHWMNEYPYNK